MSLNFLGKILDLGCWSAVHSMFINLYFIG